VDATFAQRVADATHVKLIEGERPGVLLPLVGLLRDETFIKWKPTVLYWLFALVLGASALFLRKNLLRAMLRSQLVLPEPVWTRLNWSWSAFFAFMGAANLYVAYSFPTDIWVNFKLFGGMGLLLLFVIGQAFFLAKHVEQGGSET